MIGASRLPGIYFSSQTAKLDEALPRMDIAAFVGFARSGPLHTPVAVESMSQYRDIFGEEVKLDSGVQGYLAASVEEFFGNGGLRCWIVRVAGAAETHEFTIASLQALSVAGDDSVELSPAHSLARSAGSWALQWRIEAVTRTQTLHFSAFNFADVADQGWRLDVQSAQQGLLYAGELLRFNWRDGVSWYGFADRVENLGGTVRVHGMSAYSMDLVSPAQWQRIEPAAFITSPTTELLNVQRVRCDLLASNSSGDTARVDDLAMHSRHPRFWGRLPSDQTLFAQPRGQLYPAPSGELQRIRLQARQPRFPLGGLAGFQHEGNASSQPEQYYLPVMTAAQEVLDQDTSPPLESGGAEISDGLEQIDAELFLNGADTRFNGFRTGSLLAELEHEYYIRQGDLRGIYSLLPVQEVSLLAVPDLAHLRPVTIPPGMDGPMDSAPVLSLEANENGDCLRWEIDGVDADSENGIFVLERASGPAFTDATVVYRGIGHEFRLAPELACSRGEYYRVMLQQQGLAGLWSNTVVRQPLFQTTCEDPGDTPSESDIPPVESPPTDMPVGTGMETVEQDGANAAILAVHRAMLRFCAARQDLMAVPGLPHNTPEQALEHINALLSTQLSGEEEAGVLPLSAGEARAFDFGAVFYPWLAVSRCGSSPFIPCDGAICGSMARTALRSGAWIAPANIPLADVVALQPRISKADWQRLSDAHINLVRQHGRGFLLMNADTLSLSEENRPLNVRRLMILLRRLVLREGNRDVFEPDSIDLRNRVHHYFNRLLDGLYTRGAFAGATRDAAFRVVADSSVNTTQSMDAGRFIVELRVAPSRPMEFLTVRLLQSGNADTVFVEGGMSNG